MPTAGVATWADGVAGVLAAATVWVVSALRAVFAWSACAVGAALDSVTVADACATVASASSRAAAVADVVEAVVGEDCVMALTVAACDEFDSGSEEFDVVCSASGAGVAGGVLASGGSVVSPEAAGSLESGGVSGAVGAADSGVLVCAPPLLPTVTPGATSSFDDVVPDVVVSDVVAVSVAVVPVPVVAVDEASVPVVDVVADPVDDSPDDVELVVDDSEEVPVVSAAANPWPVATAVTSHAATAMPPYPPSFAAP